MKQAHTLIVGASVSALASASCLQKKGIEYTIIERQAQVATPPLLDIGTIKHIRECHIKIYDNID